jgi:DNA-binding response OmpR family regulator
MSAALPPGYEVLAAADHATISATPPPHVIVLDIAQPGAEGLLPLRRFRSQPTFSHTGILLLSTDARRQVVLAALHNGANDYLLKSHFTAEDFLRRVNRLLDRVRSGEKFPVISFPNSQPALASEAAPSTADRDGFAISPQDLQAIIDSWE